MPNELTDLLTLDKETKKPPKSRIGSVASARGRIKELKDGDRTRAKGRSFIQALIDGEPPYDIDEMESCGRGDDANINFREAEGKVAAACTPYYELTFGVQRAINLNVEYGDNEQKKAEWSDKLAQRYSDTLWAWKGYKTNIQLCHYQRTVHGRGPIMWDSRKGWHFKAKRDDSVWVADNTMCDIEFLPELAIPGHFEPVELFEKIDNAPEDSGWDKKLAREAIIKAAPKTFKDSYHDAWGQYEASLRRGDMLWSNKASRIYYVDYLVQEFDGKITHCIVLDSTPDTDKGEQDGFVFKKVGRFGSFHEIIVPFFFDVGPDGHWYSVKGLGPKIYDSCDLSNRFLCTLINGAMASSGIFLQAKNAQSLQSIQQTPIFRASGATYVPDSWDIIPQQIQARLDGPLNVIKVVNNILESNTGEYQQLDNSPQPTLGQEELLTQGKSTLTRGAYDRYYDDLDLMHQEILRRMLDPDLSKNDSGGEEAIEMRKKLIEEDQIPEEALVFDNIKNIRAFRASGYGSAASQQIVSKQLLSMMGTMDEEGRNHVLRFVTSGLPGMATQVDRFYKKFEDMGVPNDQEAWATFENNILRQPNAQLAVTPAQNPVIHFTTHFKDAMNHMKEIQSGQGDPMQLLIHLNNAGPHDFQHLEKMKGDPTRKDQYKQFLKMHLMLARMTDQLKKQVEKAQKSNQKPNGQLDPKLIEGLLKLQSDHELKDKKLMMDESRKNVKMEADLRRKDLTTAATIHRRNAETFA